MGLEGRWSRLQDHMRRAGADAVWINEPIDLFYLTQLNLSAGTLICTADEVHLFVDGRYFEQAKRSAPCSVTLASDEAWQAFFAKHSSVRSLLFDSASLSFHAYQKLCDKLPEGFVLLPDHRLMHQVRLIKDAQELRALRKAGSLAARGYDYLVTRLRPGVTEKELAQELELFWLQQGGERLSFEPIVAFGPHAASPHHRPESTPLEEGSVVLFDIGVQVDHYQSDLTRVVFFGQPPEPIAAIYQVVKQAVEAAVATCRPGVRIADLDRAARVVIEAAGYTKAFPHSLGHGVGLEVHESPVLRASAPFGELKLDTHMVLTIEPGIYLPGLGGVRLEDTFEVTADGALSLVQRPFDPYL